MAVKKESVAKTINEAERVKGYILAEEANLSIEDLNKTEEARVELSKEDREKTNAEIKALENLLSQLPETDSIGFDEDLYNEYLADIEKADIFSGDVDTSSRINNKYAIREDLQTALMMSDNIEGVKDYLRNIGHTVNERNGFLVIDDIPSSALSWKRTDFGIDYDYTIEAMQKQIDRRLNSPLPNDSKFELMDKWEETRQLKQAAQLSGHYYNYRNGHIYLLDINEKYTRLGRRRGLIERIVIKLIKEFLLRDRKAEIEALEAAGKINEEKRVKIEARYKREVKRVEDAAKVSLKYGIYTTEEANTVKQLLGQQTTEYQTHASNVSKEIYIIRRNIEHPDYYRREGYSSKEAYIADLQRELELKTNTVNLIRSDIRDLKEDIKAIDRDLKPFLLSTTQSTKYTLDMKRAEFRDIVKEVNKEEIARRKNMILLKEQKELYDGITGTREELNKQLNRLKAESQTVTVQKCDRTLTYCHNIDNEMNVSQEFLSNLKLHRRNLPTETTAAKTPNGKGEARFAFHIEQSPHPYDKIAPSQIAEINEKLLNRVSWMKNRQAIATVHVDHFSGVDKKTGKVYNPHVEGILLDNRAHGHIEISAVDMDGKAFHDDDLSMLEEMHKVELDIMLEYGAIHTAMANAHFTELIKKQSHTDIELCKLNLATGILSYDKDTQTISEPATGKSWNVLGENIDEVIDNFFSQGGKDNLQDITKVQSLYRYEVKQRNALKQPVTILPRPELKSSSEDLVALWKHATTDPDKIKERISADIEKVLKLKPKALLDTKENQRKGIISIQGELRKLGYAVRVQKGQFKLSPATLPIPKYGKNPTEEQKAEIEEIKAYNAKVRELKEFSTKSLDSDLYGWEVFSKICTENRNYIDIEATINNLNIKYAPLVNPPKPKEPEKPAHEQTQSQVVERVERNNPKPTIPDEIELYFDNKNNKKYQGVALTFKAKEIENILQEIGGLAMQRTNRPKTPEEEQLEDIKEVLRTVLSGEIQRKFLDFDTACKHSPTMKKALQKYDYRDIVVNISGGGTYPILERRQVPVSRLKEWEQSLRASGNNKNADIVSKLISSEQSMTGLKLFNSDPYGRQLRDELELMKGQNVT